MKRVLQLTSRASSSKRSWAVGSRSMPISVPLEPMRSAISRAWPPPPTVQSTATAPGRGSSSSISSPASTGTCVIVISSSVATRRSRSDVLDGADDLVAHTPPCLAVPDLEPVADADHRNLLAEAGFLEQLCRHHHPSGGIELQIC